MRTSAEVVIIGGGVIGCSIAYNLAREKVDVVVLERDYLASGASGRCGGMVYAGWYPGRASEPLAKVSNAERLGFWKPAVRGVSGTHRSFDSRHP